MPARALKKREPSTPITMTVSGRSGRAIAKNNNEKTGRKKKPSWRGTGNVSTLNVKFRPYADAAHFVSALGLRTSREWHAYSRSGARPSDVPPNPQVVHRGTGWSGMRGWLGTG